MFVTADSGSSFENPFDDGATCDRGRNDGGGGPRAKTSDGGRSSRSSEDQWFGGRGSVRSLVDYYETTQVSCRSVVLQFFFP